MAVTLPSPVKCSDVLVVTPQVSHGALVGYRVFGACWSGAVAIPGELVLGDT
jgi:hypothetical protein